MTSSAD